MTAFAIPASAQRNAAESSAMSSSRLYTALPNGATSVIPSRPRRGRSGRQDVPERSVPSGLARRASGAHATTESGGEAKKAGGGCCFSKKRSGGAWGVLQRQQAKL
jgi:hypothetical protein